MILLPGAGSTSSISTPPWPWGAGRRRASRAMPARGCSSISRSPARAAWRASRRCRGRGRRRGAGPGPRLARNLPTGVSAPSGASSSTWFSPTSSSTASTPCSSTISRWADVQLEAVAPQLERGVDLLDGDADMVDAVEHRRGVYGSAQSAASELRRAGGSPASRSRVDGDLARGRDHAQPDPGRALQARHAGHDPVDRGAVEDLVLQQLARERVELVRGGRRSASARPAGLLDQVLALLVAQAQRRLGQPHVAVGRAPDAGGAHRVVVDHRVRDRRRRAAGRRRRRS